MFLAITVLVSVLTSKQTSAGNIFNVQFVSYCCIPMAAVLLACKAVRDVSNVNCVSRFKMSSIIH